MAGDSHKNVVFLLQPPGPDIGKADRLSRRIIINRQIAIHRHENSSKRKNAKDSSESPESNQSTPGESEQIVTQVTARRRRVASGRGRQSQARKKLESARPIPKSPNSRSTKSDDADDSLAAVSEGNGVRSLLPISTVGGSLFQMDESKSRIFQYYVHYWMPSPDEVPFACQIAGFTPVWPGDQILSTRLLAEAFQSDSLVSIYSLLTVCARRMRVINGVKGGLDLPEVYAAKAISALLEVIKEKGRLTQRLILDISYLVLSEVYVKMHKKPEVYGQMLKDLIIHFGGLQNVPHFTAHACMGWDNLISATTLVLPALDPFRSPELLSTPVVASEMNPSEIMMEVYIQVQALEPRPKSMALTSHAFSNVIQALEVFPQHAQTCIRLLARNSSPKIFRVLTTPFLFDGKTAYGCQENAAVAKLDIDLMYIKVHGYLIWLWYSALGSTDCDPTLANIMYPPPSEVSQVEIWRLTLENLLTDLGETHWYVHYPLLLWLAAVGVLVSDTRFNSHYWPDLFTRTAVRMGITTSDGLDNILLGYPSLQLICKHVQRNLWDIFSGVDRRASATTVLSLTPD